MLCSRDPPGSLPGLTTLPADSLSVRSVSPCRPTARSPCYPWHPLPSPRQGTMTGAGCLRLNPFHTSSKNPLPEKYLARRKQVIFASWRWNEPLLPAAAMRIYTIPVQEGWTQVLGCVAGRRSAGRLERVLTLETALVRGAPHRARSSNLGIHWVPVIRLPWDEN